MSNGPIWWYSRSSSSTVVWRCLAASSKNGENGGRKSGKGDGVCLKKRLSPGSFLRPTQKRVQPTRNL